MVMMLEALIKQYNEAIFDTNCDRAQQVVREAVSQGLTPEAVVFDVVLPSMDFMVKSVSEDFEVNLAQYFRFFGKV